MVIKPAYHLLSWDGHCRPGLYENHLTLVGAAVATKTDVGHLVSHCAFEFVVVPNLLVFHENHFKAAPTP